MSSRRWLVRHVFPQVVAGLILAALMGLVTWIHRDFLLSRLPVIWGYLTARIPITFSAPRWLLLAVALLIVGGLVFMVSRVSRRGFPARPVAPLKNRKMSLFDLEWEITPEFSDVAEIELPNLGTVADVIKGPYCSNCGGVVSRPRPDAWMAEVPLASVENPCGRCGHNVKRDFREVEVHQLKAEVFREVQRLQRRGKLPAP